MAHTHSPERVSRVLVKGEVFRALTCGTCGEVYGHTPWPVSTTKGAVVMPSKVAPTGNAAVDALMADALRPLKAVA